MEQVRGSSQHRAAADPPQMCLPPRTAPEALRRGSASSGRPSSCRPPSASPASSTSEIDPTPLDNAVTSAIDHSDISAQVNPQLVALVTHQVIHSLKAQGFGAGGSSSASSSSPADAHAGVPAPPRDVITPPSPTRPGDHPNRGPPPPRLDDHLDGITDGRNPIEKHSAQDPNLDQTRPSMTSRQLTGNATILEKIWQPLFDADGMPTSRLSQFLRGLAVHIIEDFEPASSLVVTPPKMQQFYNETAVPGEIYPWHSKHDPTSLEGQLTDWLDSSLRRKGHQLFAFASVSRLEMRTLLRSARRGFRRKAGHSRSDPFGIRDMVHPCHSLSSRPRVAALLQSGPGDANQQLLGPKGEVPERIAPAPVPSRDG